MSNVTVAVLILPANPVDSPRLNLASEVSQIEAAIQQSKYRDNISHRVVHVPTVSTLRNALLELPDVPLIIHFAGHADSDAIYFCDKHGLTKPLEGSHLGEFFREFSNIKCVVLNSCNSSRIAATLAEVVPYVIGMETRASDEYSIMFSVAFYDGIGARKSYSEAFAIAEKSLKLEGGWDIVRPVLFPEQVNAATVQMHPTTLPDRVAVSGVTTGTFSYAEVKSRLKIREETQYYELEGADHPFLVDPGRGLRFYFENGDDGRSMLRSIVIERPFHDRLSLGLSLGISEIAALDLLNQHYSVDHYAGQLHCMPIDSHHRNGLIVHCLNNQVVGIEILEL